MHRRNAGGLHKKTKVSPRRRGSTSKSIAVRSKACSCNAASSRPSRKRVLGTHRTCGGRRTWRHRDTKTVLRLGRLLASLTLLRVALGVTLTDKTAIQTKIQGNRQPPLACDAPNRKNARSSVLAANSKQATQHRSGNSAHAETVNPKHEFAHTSTITRATVIATATFSRLVCRVPNAVGVLVSVAVCSRIGLNLLT
jgi:hypothetical protein